MAKFIMRQDGQNYYIFHPQVGLICHVWLGCDGQYAKDVECMTVIGRALKKRWDLN